MKARQIEIRKQANLSADRHTQLIGDWAEHRIGFINGADWADSHPHWISVDDELPQKLEAVICTNGHDVKVGFYDCDDSGDHVMWAAPCMGCYDVTHWMPLPAPPTCSGKPNNCKKGGEK